MDDEQQEHVVDASLLLPRGAGGVLQIPSGNSSISRHQLSSSDNSSIMVSPSKAERKRKRMSVSNSTGDGPPKKIKNVAADQGPLDFGSVPASRRDVSLQLPAEVWQHIFSFLPPHTLGTLLRVNKLFNQYLDPASPFTLSAPAFRVPSIVPALLPDAIWRASRCLFWPRMPTPLSGKSELDMWRFACSRSCQICGQIDETNVAWDSLPWRRGPGNNTVSPIFVFFVNSCGKCLAETSVKEVDVLLSTSTPSVLIPGLPMAFLTADLNVVYTQSIKTTQVPTSVPLTRIYWPTQVESLRLEFEDVKRFGPAAAEEWIKGLEARGADAIHKASRWEKWYLAGGVSQMLIRCSSTPPQPTTRGELKIMKRAEGKNALAAKASEKHQANSTAKKGTETALQDEHDAETLVKIRISALADQFIGDHLSEGQSIEQEGHAQFIIGVMAYVRKQYYAEFSKIDSTSSAPKLTLGDMVWIFDHKVKQILADTDQDLFSCRKCLNSKKRFGFSAFIHHYLSKHALKHGPKPGKEGKKLRNRLRIDWPEEFPFESSPIQQVSTVDSKPLSSQTTEVDDAYKPRIDAMAKAITSVWKIMKYVKHISFSAKLLVSIYHVAKEFQEDDPELVPLDTFVDVLNHFKSSPNLATYHGLACKICMLSQTREEDDKCLFTLPGLAKHFHVVHEKGGVPLTDWRVDLIWLPDMQMFQDLRTKVWESKRAFKLTSEALPWLFESEGETSQGGPCSTLPNALTKGLEAADAASNQIIHRPDEGLHGDVPKLLSASVVYVRSDTIQEQARYDTVVARAASINERMPQVYETFDRIRAQRTITEGSSVWGSSRTNSQTFSPREGGPEPGRHLSSFHPHNEYDPQVAEEPNEYPYYPDMEIRGAHSHIEAGNGLDGSYYIPSGHRQPIPSARLYHYGDSVSSYDRHGSVDARHVSNGYYTQHPAMMREYRIFPTAERFDYTNLEPHRSTAPQRAYDSYASRYALANRRPGV
ncbi:hypothetical protein TRIATDRAFT_31581 [Trichoderma atroviride IMI 206040]|uniref:Uncharacterized protein n=1 Tax=Hypocrea atroviridis (strain ATCC 20476 / IMI 206040) TaxID=452589 RepID=G9P6J6_HYPAI|nr:uncharacterized protein TRIATDRAFT_31581 [Trichoderma atroviride IMI 206040]EHK40639.1 hypothetical protein TRIATDRAFT_31581 [Trichoderma atroviride IMI 206040]